MRSEKRARNEKIDIENAKRCVQALKSLYSENPAKVLLDNLSFFSPDNKKHRSYIQRKIEAGKLHPQKIAILKEAGFEYDELRVKNDLARSRFRIACCHAPCAPRERASLASTPSTWQARTLNF